MSEHSHKERASAKSIFGLYLKHVARYPFFMTAVVLGAIGVQCADLAGPWAMRYFFNVLGSGTPTPSRAADLLSTVVIVGVIWFASQFMRRIQDFSTSALESRVMKDLFSSTFEYLIGHSFNFFISRFAGTLTHRVTKFSRAFEVLFDSIMSQFFPKLF